MAHLIGEINDRRIEGQFAIDGLYPYTDKANATRPPPLRTPAQPALQRLNAEPDPKLCRWQPTEE